jgi:hypothetical protein
MNKIIVKVHYDKAIMCSSPDDAFTLMSILLKDDVELLEPCYDSGKSWRTCDKDDLELASIKADIIAPAEQKPSRAEAEAEQYKRWYNESVVEKGELRSRTEELKSRIEEMKSRIEELKQKIINSQFTMPEEEDSDEDNS